MQVNGVERSVDLSQAVSLAAVLRDELDLTSVKLACERGECGSCTVLMGDLPVNSCMIPLALVSGPVTTVEGLEDESRQIREALADRGGFQCGFCTPGQVVHAVSILRGEIPADPIRARELVRRQLSGNICRCTGSVPIVEAVLEVIAARGQVDGGEP